MLRLVPLGPKLIALMLVFYGCCNTLPQTRWLETTEIDSVSGGQSSEISILEPKSRCLQACAPPQSLWGESVPHLFRLLVAAGIPGLLVASLQIYLCSIFTSPSPLCVIPLCFPLFFLILFLFIYLFIYLAALGLCCCMWAFSSCIERGLLFVAVRGLLIAVVSLVAKLGFRREGFSSCGSQALGAHGLICSTACGIFLDQGSNPCPLHWQADS